MPQPFSRCLHLDKDKPTAEKHAHTKTSTESKSDSRMIEVCACLSSVPVQAAALSEHAPDEVSQGVEKAVITGSVEGHWIRQTALRGVRQTQRTCLHVSGPG